MTFIVILINYIYTFCTKQLNKPRKKRIDMNRYLILFLILLLFGLSAQAQVTYPKKRNPFFQKISLVSDVGVANKFAMSHIADEEIPKYVVRPRMLLGLEVETPYNYFQFSGNIAEACPELKIGVFIIKEHLVLCSGFSQQLKPAYKHPEGVFSLGIESNFDFLKLFLKEKNKSNHDTELYLCPFVELNTILPSEEKWFNFGFILKPKYNLFRRETFSDPHSH